MLGLRGSAGLLTEIGRSLLKNLSLRCQRVQCLRIGNAELPNDKKLMISLQQIRGIGRQRAHKILVDLSLANKPTKNLTPYEAHNLRDEVSKYLIGEELARAVRSDIQKLADIQCYRGFNHASSLPCRGQRTKTNARTRKGMKTINKGGYEKQSSLAERMQQFQERSKSK